MKHTCTEPGTEEAEAGELPWLEAGPGHTEGSVYKLINQAKSHKNQNGNEQLAKPSWIGN